MVFGIVCSSILKGLLNFESRSRGMYKSVRFMFFFAIILSFTVLFVSCEGDQGPVGPEGPAGENADFEIINISFTGAQAGISGSSAFYSVNVSEITQEVVDNGAVIIYFNISMGETPSAEWILMPFSRTQDSDLIFFEASFSLAQINLAFLTTASAWPFPDSYYYHFKIIILNEPLAEGINAEDFEEVKTHYERKEPGLR